jgi:hypothetical protein
MTIMSTTLPSAARPFFLAAGFGADVWGVSAERA